MQNAATAGAALGVRGIGKRAPRDIPVAVKAVVYVITTAISMSCALPLLLVLSISLTDEKALSQYGYSLIPPKWGFQGYEYIFTNGSQILRSYGVTIFVAATGTVLGLVIMSMYAYVIANKSFRWKKHFTFFLFFTMLFSGGMLSSYIINTNVFHLKDTIAVLILPACMSGMYVLIIRTYITTSIPVSVVESAKMDGAGEFLCYARIVLPMAVPSLATIGLFLTVSYWNNWILGFLYILTNNKIVPLQLLLKRIEVEIQFLAQNAGIISAAEQAAMQATIPSETVKMSLVIIVILPILIAYPYFQRYFIKGITIGAVKG